MKIGWVGGEGVGGVKPEMTNVIFFLFFFNEGFPNSGQEAYIRMNPHLCEYKLMTNDVRKYIHSLSLISARPSKVTIDVLVH